MSQTKRERKKIAKKITRRKSFVKERNRMKGRVAALAIAKKENHKTETVDGADFYKKLKEQEAKETKVKQPKKTSLFKRLGRVFTKGDR